MMERGEIGATIDAAMGMVSFQADLDRASSLVLLSRLEKQMQVNKGCCHRRSCSQPHILFFVAPVACHSFMVSGCNRGCFVQIANELNEKLRQVDEVVSCSNSYLSKVTMQDRQSRWGEPGGLLSVRVGAVVFQADCAFVASSGLAWRCCRRDGGRNA